MVRPYGWCTYALYQHIILCKYPVNGLHNMMAQAIGFVQDGTVGRTCESAPTICVNLMAHSGLICTEPQCSGGLHNMMAQAIGFVQDGTVGRTCESAPTICVNLMAHSGLICTEPQCSGGLHNMMAQAIGFMQDGTVGRTYESAPTHLGYVVQNLHNHPVR